MNTRHKITKKKNTAKPRFGGFRQPRERLVTIGSPARLYAMSRLLPVSESNVKLIEENFELVAGRVFAIVWKHQKGAVRQRASIQVLAHIVWAAMRIYSLKRIKGLRSHKGTVENRGDFIGRVVSAQKLLEKAIDRIDELGPEVAEFRSIQDRLKMEIKIFQQFAWVIQNVGFVEYFIVGHLQHELRLSKAVACKALEEVLSSMHNLGVKTLVEPNKIQQRVEQADRSPANPFARSLK